MHAWVLVPSTRVKASSCYAAGTAVLVLLLLLIHSSPSSPSPSCCYCFFLLFGSSSVVGWCNCFLRLTVSPQSSHESRISVCKFTNYILKMHTNILVLYEHLHRHRTMGCLFCSHNSTTAADRLLNSEL